MEILLRHTEPTPNGGKLFLDDSFIRSAIGEKMKRDGHITGSPSDMFIANSLHRWYVGVDNQTVYTRLSKDWWRIGRDGSIDYDAFRDTFDPDDITGF